MHKEQDTNQTKKWVWIPQAKHAFIPAYIHTSDDTTATVITQDNQKIVLPANQIYKMNPSKFNMAEDLALLSHLNEPSVMHNLRQRYEQDYIYTYSGLFLLAINPYKDIYELYDNKTILKYKNRTTQSRNYVNSDNLQPHIFAVSNDAYNSMLMNKDNQSILITGESGAGKTENTKKVINFLAHIANKTETDNSSSIDENVSHISAKILETNRILESFGNAQTIKNDNSSRFGKFIKIEFNNGKITGAYVEKYLLEKSRVTRINKNERGFHIFYQLLQALRKNNKNKTPENKKKETQNMRDYSHFLDELRTSLRFSENVKITDFHYIKNTNKKIENTDDANDFYLLCQSMDVLEFTKDEKIGIFKIISIVLHLGNLKFKEENEQAEIENFETLQTICDLLKINQNHFITSLLSPITRAGNEDVVYSRTKEQVTNIVEALSRLLYERMFDSIINKVNNVLGRNTYFEKRNTNFIGVLDIAGFEIFDKNDFEQFCINFTNEKLQQFFNHHMFILEQEIYKKENINWKFIDFGLNLQPTIDVIEKSNPIGILSYLDEECVMPKGTDKTFLEKLRDIEKNKSKYVQNQKLIFYLSKLAHSFVVEHYAGKVEYIVDDWLKKNKDPHFDYLTSLLKQSTDEYVQLLFTFDSQGKKGFFRTVAQKHKDSLNLLMEQLRKTNPYFVRCMIPNNEKRSNHLVNSLILHQLKCNGVMEGIRISRQGYPTRMLFKEFMKRYQILSEKSKELEDNKKACMVILNNIENEININTNKGGVNDKEMYKLGNTMIFFRQGVLAEIEDLRERKIDEIASVMQALIRKRLTIKKYNLQKIRGSAIKVIQKNARLSNEFMQWNWWKLYLKIKPLLEITKMDCEIKNRDDKIMQLNNEISIERERNEETKRMMKVLENEKRKLEKEIENERSILTEREDLLNGLRVEKSKINEKLKVYEESIKEMKNEANNMKNKMIDIENEKESELKKKDELCKEIQLNKNEIKKMNEELNKMKNENKELQNNLIEKEVILKNTKITTTTQINEIIANKEKEIMQLKNELKKMNEEMHKRVEEMQKIEKEKREHENTINKMETENDKMKQNIEELEKNVKILAEENKGLLCDIENVKGKNVILKDTISKIKLENEDFAVENEKIRQENVGIERRYKKSEECLKEMNEYLMKEKLRNETLADNIKNLERELKDTKENLEDEKEKTSLKSQSHENLIEKIKMLNKQINDLKEENENYENEVEMYKKENINLKEDNEKIQKSKLDEIFERENDFKKEKKNLKNIIQELEKLDGKKVIDPELLDIENNKRKKMESLLKNYEAENVRLANEIVKMRMENEGFVNKIKSLENMNEKQERDEDVKKKLTDEIENMKRVIEEKVKRLYKTFNESILKYKNELENKTIECINKDKEIAELNSKQSSEREMKDERKDFVNENEMKVANFVEINNALIVDNKRLKNELEEKENEIENYKIKNNKMKQNLESLEYENKAKMEKIEKESMRNKNKIRNLEEKLELYKNDMNKRNEKEDVSAGDYYYIKDGCTFDKCNCDSNKDHDSKVPVDTKGDGEKNVNYINKDIECNKIDTLHNTGLCCKRDYKTLKLISDLQRMLETEKEKSETIKKEKERLNVVYSAFSKDFDVLLNNEKENKAEIKKLNKETNILKNSFELKNKEIYFLNKEIQNYKNEIEMGESLIKNYEYQCNEMRRRIKENDLQKEVQKVKQQFSEALSEEKKRKDEFEDKMMYFEKENEKLRNKESEMKRKIFEKESLCKILDGEIEKWKAEVVELEMKVNCEKMKVNQLERELEDRKSICDTFVKNGIFN